MTAASLGACPAGSRELGGCPAGMGSPMAIQLGLQLGAGDQGSR